MGKVSEIVYFDFKLANHVSVQYQNDNVTKYYIFRNLPKNKLWGVDTNLIHRIGIFKHDFGRRIAANRVIGECCHWGSQEETKRAF